MLVPDFLNWHTCNLCSRFCSRFQSSNVWESETLHLCVIKLVFLAVIVLGKVKQLLSILNFLFLCFWWWDCFLFVIVFTMSAVHRITDIYHERNELQAFKHHIAAGWRNKNGKLHCHSECVKKKLRVVVPKLVSGTMVFHEEFKLVLQINSLCWIFSFLSSSNAKLDFAVNF
jgi:hypothetical protein